jgi:hypothetical protein
MNEKRDTIMFIASQSAHKWINHFDGQRKQIGLVSNTNVNKQMRTSNWLRCRHFSSRIVDSFPGVIEQNNRETHTARTTYQRSSLSYEARHVPSIRQLRTPDRSRRCLAFVSMRFVGMNLNGTSLTMTTSTRTRRFTSSNVFRSN